MDYVRSYVREVIGKIYAFIRLLKTMNMQEIMRESVMLTLVRTIFECATEKMELAVII